MFHLIVSVFVLLISAGCATQRPVLYPNEQLQRVGSSVADDAINQCMRRAEEYAVSNGQTGKSVQGAANEAATSATIGAAAGAAGGAVVGRAGAGAGIGAASGGAAAATRGLIHSLSGKQNPSPVYKNFVDRCLRAKGYDPIGWQ
jgi:outer membrane lipoprotein SlyB